MTSLFKEVFDTVRSSILVILNVCLMSRSVPAAVVQLLIRMTKLDPTVLSIRPISKLPFLPIYFGSFALVLPLDLTAACDTANHEILISYLELGFPMWRLGDTSRVLVSRFAVDNNKNCKICKKFHRNLYRNWPTAINLPRKTLPPTGKI